MAKISGASPERVAAATPNHRFRRVFLFLLVVVMLVLAIVLAQIQAPRWQAILNSQTLLQTETASPGAVATVTKTETGQPPTPTSTTTSTITHTPDQPAPASPTAALFAPPAPASPGVIIFSTYENGYNRLYAYHPQNLPLTRITNGDWDDITPAASPDGKSLSFASNRDGAWDLYIMELASGELQKVTDTPEYDGAPSWSPDSKWLAYETLTTTLQLPAGSLAGSPGATPAAGKVITDSIQNLEIFILPADRSQAPIRLTNHPAPDHAPAWSPNGRLIAFVSNRSGEEEIWLANLDQVEDRFQNLSRRPAGPDLYPAWSPDGNALAWSSSQDGLQEIWVKDVFAQDKTAYQLGAGLYTAWNSQGNALAASADTPNQSYLTVHAVGAPGLGLLPLLLPGPLHGITWSSASLTGGLPAPIDLAAKLTPTPPWAPALSLDQSLPSGRQQVVDLPDVDAPYPLLQDLVDESFIALRKTVARQVGWDVLASLENAFVPLTAPLFPGKLNDWLYTGRAFSLNPVPMNAGWLVVAREDYGAATYWRIYLRARFQDGSQGQPLRSRLWDFTARYIGDPQAYEQGGAPSAFVPPGYWIDFTRLAASYGWERLPALSTWRYAMAAARFNEFVFLDNLDWYSAMRQVYPAEALYTPTPVMPPTFTPTNTRRPTLTRTATRTPWPTRTPTPTRTTTLTRTPTITNTVAP
jgi:TolB protein